ncbi:hypothetical protein PR048_001487 [Dryococelus australis]|uniref:Uncharacterized protein n=1 Tax=Dryococelus australis TaxID=614101 RepID=A0ABQ9IHM3_9NEOP|nr:hypothetical protein PR048_001487 [Dryococelus australis]
MQDQVDFNQGKHTERLDEIYDLYYSTITILDTLSHNSKSGQSSKRAYTFVTSDKNLAAVRINFSNLFESLIINNKDLSNVELFPYLKQALEGEPLALVQSLPLTGENFEVAWTLLVKLYDSKRLIMSHHIDAILQVPVAHLNSTVPMCYFLSTVNENMAALKANKLPVDQWDILLLHLFEKHVSVDLQRMWELIVQALENPTLQNFLTLLERQCKSGEAVSKSILNWKVQGQLHTSKGAYLVPQPQFVVCAKVNIQFIIAVCLARKVQGKDLSVLRSTNFASIVYNPLTRSETIHQPLLVTIAHLAIIHFCISPVLILILLINNHMNLQIKKKDPSATVLSSFSEKASCATVMLSTAVVEVQDTLGNFQQCHSVWHKEFSCVLKPCGKEGPCFSAEMLVLPRLTGHIPCTPLKPEVREHLSHLKLADPNYTNSDCVDMLVGAKLFPYIITGTKLEGPPDTLVALDSV